jgi:TonB family protein
VICIAILAMVGTGWVFLDAGIDEPAGPGRAKPAAEGAAEATEGVAAAAPVDDETVVSETPPALAASVESSVVEANLRKARMAAEADILIEPDDRSAVFFFSEVLQADPEHAVARAELDAVLNRLALRAADMLAAEDFTSAFGLAQKIERVRPDHELVSDVQQALNRASGDLVASALEQAEQGDAEAAGERIEQAAALPGQNPEYLEAVRDAVDDLLRAREAARAQAAEERRQSAAQATAAWMASVREAIDEERLVENDGDNALTLLKQRNESGEIARQLKSEWLTAALAKASSAIADGQLDAAEALIAVAEAEYDDDEDVSRSRGLLEDAYAARESARVLPVSELAAVEQVPALYPRRAEERGISGWVDVEFTVTVDGTTRDIAVTGAEPESIFDESALDAVSRWTFEPRQYRGSTLEQRASARLVFRLE